MAHHAVAAGKGDEVAFEADQPTRRDFGGDGHAGGVMLDVCDFTEALAQVFHDSAKVFLRHFNPDLFVRFAAFALDLAEQYGRP